MKGLYIDCTAGIAGDMMVAALLELGLPLSYLKEQLDLLSLPAGSFKLGSEQVNRQGIMARRLLVEAADDHQHRHYSDIKVLLAASGLPARSKELSLAIFARLAEAEAKVHGVLLDKVHFHEVGAVDSIIDIVGTAVGVDYLGIETISAAPLPYGSGWVDTAHGRLPVPAPATAELLQGLPVHFDIGPGERVTPTGAAIVAALVNSQRLVTQFRVAAIGSGAGSRDYSDVPNILRLVMTELPDKIILDNIYVLETHIDDMNPEIFGFLMERLLAAGALDVAFSPLQMKKNRPATRLTLLSSQHKLAELASLVLTESTAAGVRYYPVERLTLERTCKDLDSSLGRVKVKVFEHAGNFSRVVPEFEECRRIALEKDIPLIEVYKIIEREAAGS